MKKRLLSILLLCCMVLTLPLGMAAAEETAGTATEVKTSEGLTAALEGSAETVRLGANITITTEDSLTVRRTVTLNLNGCVLEKAGSGSVIKVDSGGNLTLMDSNTIAEHKFTPDANGVWGLDEQNGTETVTGGVIAGGTGTDGCGGGVFVSGGGSFTMNGGSIAGCVVRTTTGYALGGGVYVANRGTFNMTGGSIENCKASADGSSAFGGGIYNAGRTTLSGTAKIRNCQAANAGGGIYDYSILNISDNVEIEITSCTAPLWSAMVASGTISGGTFNGTVTSGGRITGGTFNGEVRNVGTITGGTFNGQVTNPGCITGGTFKGGITGTPALATGSGAANDPYQIGTAAGLKWFRDMVNSGEYGLCAELTDDIDLENEAWTPIMPIAISTEDANYGYCGIFDGGGHTISGLNVTGNSEYAGLFGYTSNATIRNLTVAGSVTGPSESGIVGGIVGYAGYGTIENCGNLCIVNGNTAGGIVGHAYSTTISACYNAGEISGGSNAAGGLVGWFQGAKGVFYDCYNVGTVSSVNNYAGGIVGLAGVCRVYNCYNAGAVTSDGDGAYGIGYGAWIENSYYLKGTTADSHIGAIEKSAEEFADGTVLALLKAGERGSNADPWADTCQYVDAASLTLPVFRNQNTHKHTLQHVEAKAATTSEEGNIEYWYCEACGRYFADGTAAKEITKADTVLARLPYIVDLPGYPVTVPDKTEHGSVTVSPKNASAGSTVTVTVTPDSGYVLETISVTDRNGSDLKLADKGGGRFTFTMPSGPVTVAVTFMDDNTMLNFFVDVPAGAYYYDAVLWAAEGGIAAGTDAVHFSPDDTCTRAQIVTFLWRAAGSPVVNYLMPFTDVDEGAYYAEAVRWAASTGIVTGLTETAFGPNGACTRAQAVTFLFRAAAANGLEAVTLADLLSGFEDAASVPGYAVPAMNWALSRDIVKGSGTQLLPGDTCTRAQIVTFLWRCMK